MSTNQTEWFKSSYSMQNGECVEACRNADGLDVRDSKDPYGPRLHFSADAWHAFIAEVKIDGLPLA